MPQLLGLARALKDRDIAQKLLNPTYTLQYVVASERSERSNPLPGVQEIASAAGAASQRYAPGLDFNPWQHLTNTG
jgi:hypothetical protein